MTDVVKTTTTSIDTKVEPSKFDPFKTAPKKEEKQNYVPQRGDYVKYGEVIGRVHSVQFDKLEPDGSVSPDAKAVFVTLVSVDDKMELKSEVVPVIKLSFVPPKFEPIVK